MRNNALQGLLEDSPRVYRDFEQEFRDEVLKGLQSIDMNLSLILKALQKPIKTKKKTK